MKRIFYLLPIILAGFSCQIDDSNSPETSEAEVQESKSEKDILEGLTIEEDATHFFVLGDWGRNGYEHQKDVADMMQKTALVLEPEFIVSTGDNFYPNGIASVSDPYWKTSFEDIYDGNLMFVPWYVALGNHDYRGNAEAQIAYSDISRRWTMPSRYYTVDKLLEDDQTKLKLIVIDTNPFEDDYYGESKYADAVSGQDTTAQLVWLENELSNTSSEWTIVIGHHPFYTSGKRVEDEPFVRKHFEKVFEKHMVHAYFAGHEHDLQHQKPGNIKTHHFVSGAGSEVRPTGKLDYTLFAESVSGFMAVSLLENEMIVQAIDYKGNVLYKTVIPR